MRGGVYVFSGSSSSTSQEGFMIKVWSNDDKVRREDAAAWVVCLEGGSLGDAEALGFDAWISASLENVAAFDDALAVSQTYAAHQAPVAKGLTERHATDRRTVRHVSDRRAFMAFGAVAAAAVFAVVVAPQISSAPDTQIFVTAKGERRSITLADGSRIDLNAGTRLSVRLGREAREVTLAQGQAVFDVAHDADRPFTVAAGDRLVRVTGTQFDVRRRDGRLAVTVARGAVEVRPAVGLAGTAYRLRPGQRLDHMEGAPVARVAAVQADEVLAWRTGRLVYRDQPLGDVVADLNEQWSTSIRLDDAELASRPVSGVLILDNQDDVIRRLALLVPIRAVRSDAGIVLRRDTASVR